MKKSLMGLMAIALTTWLVGAGVSAYFSDKETSTGNSFTAGTWDTPEELCGVEEFSGIIEGEVNENLNLHHGNWLVAEGASVNGSITLNSGTLCVMGRVKGNLEQRGHGSVVLIGALIEGNVEERGPGDVRVLDASTLHGNLEERGPGECTVSEDSVVFGHTDCK